MWINFLDWIGEELGNYIKLSHKHYNNSGQRDMEEDGYRAKSGISIVLRLNPGKPGILNLREVTAYLLL